MWGGRRGSVRRGQLYSNVGDELVDVWISASRAAGHPETLGKRGGTLRPTHNKPSASGCSSLLRVCSSSEQSSL